MSEKHSIHCPARDIPVRAEADVLVVGGGPAGIMAAEAEAQAIMQVQTALADSLKLLNAAAPNDQVVKLKSTVEDKSEEDVLKDLKKGARKGSAYGNRKHAAYGSSRAN